MAGNVVRVLSLRELDFTSVSTGSSVSVVVARQIDVSPYTRGDLVARLHSVTWPETGDEDAQVDVSVVQDGRSSEDPSREFTGATLTTASFLQDSTPPAGPGDVRINDLVATSPLGSMLSVKAVGDRNGTSTGTFKATISVDLVMRE